MAASDPPELGVFLATLTLGNPWSPTADAVVTAADAAAAAGFGHVGISRPAVSALAAAGADPAAVLSERGLRVSCLEALFGWSTDGDAARAEAAAALDDAGAVGADLVMAVELGDRPVDVERAAANLALVAEVLGGAGVSPCVEFLPWSGIPDLATAWAVVGPVPSARLLVDTWHWARQPGGPDPRLLASIPADRVAAVQLCDTQPGGGRGDLMAEAMTRRLDPGEGDADIGGVLATLRAMGAAPRWSVEVFDPHRLAAEGPARRAEQQFRAARRAMAA